MAQSFPTYSSGPYQPPPVAQQPYQTQDDSQACYNCGSTQHWAQFCPEPRRQVPAGSLRGKSRPAKNNSNNNNNNNNSNSKKSSRPVITRYAPPPGYVPPNPTPVTPSAPTYPQSAPYGSPGYTQLPQTAPGPAPPAPQQWQQSPQSYSAPQWQQSTPTTSYGPQQHQAHSAYGSAPQTPYSAAQSPGQSFPAQSFSTPQGHGYAPQPSNQPYQAQHNAPAQNGYSSHTQASQYPQPVAQNQPPLPSGPPPPPTHYSGSPTQYSQPPAQPSSFTPYQPPPFTSYSQYPQARPSPVSFASSPNQQFPPRHGQSSQSNNHNRHHHHNHHSHHNQHNHNQHNQHNQNRGGRSKRFRPATPSENISPRPPTPPPVFPRFKPASANTTSPQVWKAPQSVKRPISATYDEAEDEKTAIPETEKDDGEENPNNLSGTRYFTTDGMPIHIDTNGDPEKDEDPIWKSVRTGGSTKVELEDYKWEDDEEGQKIFEQLKKSDVVEEVNTSNGCGLKLPATGTSPMDLTKMFQPEGKKRSWEDSFSQKPSHDQERRPNKRRHGNDGRNRRGNRTGQGRQGKGYNRNAGTGPSVPTLQIPTSNNAPPVQRSFHPLPPKPTTAPPPPPSAAYLEKLPETADAGRSASTNGQSANPRRSASPDSGIQHNTGWRQRDYDRPNGNGDVGRVPDNADVRRRGTAAMEVYNRRW